MYFLQYIAEPIPATEAATQFGGAFVSCWIARATLDNADQVACSMIEDQGWAVLSQEKALIVSASDYVESPEDLEHFNQAQVDMEALVFDTWPIGKSKPR